MDKTAIAPTNSVLNVNVALIANAQRLVNVKVETVKGAKLITVVNRLAND